MSVGIATKGISVSPRKAPVRPKTDETWEASFATLERHLVGLSDYIVKARNVHFEVKEGVKNAYKEFIELKAIPSGAKIPSQIKDDKNDLGKVQADNLMEKTVANNEAKQSPPTKVLDLLGAIVKESQEKILGAIVELRATKTLEAEHTWTEGARRPKKAKPQARLDQQQGVGVVRRTVRNRPPAILVSVGQDSYAGALKKLKMSDSVRELAEDITTMSKTSRGDIVVKLKHGATSAARLTDAISEVVSDTRKVKEMTTYEKLLIQDLDELAEEIEVVESVGKLVQADTKEIRIVRNFAVDRGMRWMVVSMPLGLVNKALQKGKLRVGFVSCRLRRWEERRTDRCPRCLVDGHLAKDCNGPDRRKNCRACGE